MNDPLHFGSFSVDSKAQKNIYVCCINILFNDQLLFFFGVYDPHYNWFLQNNYKTSACRP